MSTFKGPLFIVGKPRSGTKLLYRLLSNHPQIKLADEMQFLPFLLKKKKFYYDLSHFQTFLKFYNTLSKSHYFTYKKRRKCLLSAKKWYSLCDNFTMEGVIETLVRYYTKSLNDPNIIWGDKSPNYTNQAGEIKKYFKQAKFIHIIRDPRDAATSAHRVWGTNIYRFAQRWYNDINKLHKDQKYFDNDTCLEVTYEDLVSMPKFTVDRILKFLGLSAVEEILTLKQPSENYGGAKGWLKIKKDNTTKYLAQMDYTDRLIVESITYPLLKHYGYQYTYQGKKVKINESQMLIYKFSDFFNRLIFEIHQNRSSKTKSVRNLITGHYIK